MNSPTASAPRESQHHIKSLDGIRGLAISLVLLTHLLRANTQTGSRFIDFVGKIRGAGWVGVDLFFALSGFLITGILFDTLESNHYFKNFYARRMLRIVPLYYGVIFAVFIFLHPTSFAQARPLLLLLVYLQNTPLWWNAVNPPHLAIALTGHLWSLAVEEQFYIVWPIIIFLVRDRRKLLCTAVGLAALAPITRIIMLTHGASFGAVYNCTICRADSLLSGAWLALAMRGNLRATLLRYAAPVLVLSLLACIAIAWRAGNFDWESNLPINLYGYSVLAIGNTALIAMSLRTNSFVANTMRSGFLRFLGRYSYGIYVFHQIVAVFVNATMESFLYSYIQSKMLFHLVFTITVLALTIPLAWLSYHFYEQLFLNLKKYFSGSPRQTRQEVAASATSSKV